MLGYGRELDVFNLNDTATLKAFVYTDEDAPIAEDDLSGVSFVVQRPDATKETVEGVIDGDGVGAVNYENTADVGQYIVVATFTLIDGVKRSVRVDFEVIDPFNPPEPTADEILADAVWHKFEDSFDANDEGPWLRDQTLNYFNKTKMPEFAADAIFEINNANPVTTADLNFFVHDGAMTLDGPLLIQGTYMAVLRHLIRSYTEQPLPTGAPFGYLDRRDYAQRWQMVYQMEMETFRRWLALWKRSYLQLGHSKLLISAKAGRLMPAPMRTRYVGRGYW